MRCLAHVMYYSVLKKNDITKFTRNLMDLDRLLSKVTQSQSTMHSCMYINIHMCGYTVTFRKEEKKVIFKRHTNEFLYIVYFV